LGDSQIQNVFLLLELVSHVWLVKNSEKRLTFESKFSAVEGAIPAYIYNAGSPV